MVVKVPRAVPSRVTCQDRVLVLGGGLQAEAEVRSRFDRLPALRSRRGEVQEESPRAKSWTPLGRFREFERPHGVRNAVTGVRIHQHGREQGAGPDPG